MSSKLRWFGDKAKAAVLIAGMQALSEGGEVVLTESQEEVPHATGTLQRSGTVTKVPSELSVYISYNTPYAVRQHEDLNLRHSIKGRKAKYLEDPFNRLKRKISRLAELRIKRALR